MKKIDQYRKDVRDAIKKIDGEFDSNMILDSVTWDCVAETAHFAIRGVLREMIYFGLIVQVDVIKKNVRYKATKAFSQQVIVNPYYGE